MILLQTGFLIKGCIKNIEETKDFKTNNQNIKFEKANDNFEKGNIYIIRGEIKETVQNEANVTQFDEYYVIEKK